MAGFAVLAFPFEAGFSALSLTTAGASPVSDPVVTSLAGFAGG
jgi:hypothetical protein